LVGTANSKQLKKLSRKSTWKLTCLLKSTKTPDVDATVVAVVMVAAEVAVMVTDAAAAVVAMAAEIDVVAAAMVAVTDVADTRL
jgi:hypothetical protein